jgi:hypothetical protein
MAPNITVVRDVTPDSLVDMYQHFRVKLLRISEARPGHCSHTVVPMM